MRRIWKRWAYTFLADKYETVTISSNTLLIGGIAEAPVSYEKYASGFLEDFAAQPGYKMLLVHYPEYYAEDTGALIGKDIDMALAATRTAVRFGFRSSARSTRRIRASCPI